MYAINRALDLKRERMTQREPRGALVWKLISIALTVMAAAVLAAGLASAPAGVVLH